MSWHRSLSLAALLPALAAGSLGGASVAAATGGTEPSVSATVAGGAASAVAAGDVVDVTRTAPISLSGQTGQALDARWDPTQASLRPGGVTAPDGWGVEYTADGSTWSGTAPTDLATVSGVRAAGVVDSQGLSSGLQVSTATASGALKPAAAAFSGSSGGDGWDVFFTSTKVLNVWHHNGSEYGLDCHLRATGASCGTVYRVSGYQTSGASSGSAVGDRVFSAVGQTSSNTIGVLCTDTSTTPFTSCGYTPLVTGSASWTSIGSQSRSGSRIYVPASSSGGQLGCFDTATGVPCQGQPYALTGLSPLNPVPAFSIAAGGRVIITATKLWCFDGATGSACGGSWPVSIGSTTHAAVPMRSTDGTLTGVCKVAPAGSCYDLTGAAVSMPAALAALLSAKPFGEMTGWAQFGFTGTRQYWFTGWNAPPVCWDWATGAACAGFQTSTSIGSSRYAIVVDPLDDSCLWSNGDDGQIKPFDGITGTAGCRPSDPTVVLPYTAAVPQLSCTEAGRVRGWQSITLSAPAGLALSSLRLTMRTESGTAVSGYSNLTPDSAGAIDLSALAVATSGTRPSFEVRAVGGTDAQARGITGAIRYTSDPPQLCVKLTVRRDCPTAAAVHPGATVPVGDLTLGGSATATAGGSSTTTPLTVGVSRAAMTGCLGDLAGTVTRAAGGASTPLGGVTVRLIGPGGAVLATTTTASDGTYAVAHLTPAAYTVRVGDEQQAVSPTAGGTARADFDITVGAPTARPVQVTTAYGTPGSVPIDASADPATIIDEATLRLKDGSSWVTTLTVAGEGTWEVVSGRLRFTPIGGFTGASSQVTYRVFDGVGGVAESGAHAVVGARPAFSLSSTPVTGVAGSPSEIPVTGIPAGATATVPATVDGASAVSITGSVVSVTPSAGFSGIITVPVRVTLGGTTVVHDVLVRVHPEAAPSASTVRRSGRSVIRWDASPTGSVTRYVVFVDGKRKCVTTGTKCSVSRLVGPATDVQIRAVGGADLTSQPTAAPYKSTGCSTFTNVHFRPDSAHLKKKVQKRLARIVKRIEANGFTHLCLTGHTDSRGGVAYNKDLSERRVATVGHRLDRLLKGVQLELRYRGERAPEKRNDTKKGRASNRRVSIGLG